MFSLFGLLFIGIGVALVYWGRRARAKARLSLSWPSVDGVIVGSGIEGKEFQHSDNLTTVVRYRPTVTYSFKVRGKERQGTDIAVGLNNLFGEMGIAEKRAARYPVGAKVRVYYDPVGAACVLEPGNRESAVTIASIGVGFAVVGGAFLVIGVKLG